MAPCISSDGAAGARSTATDLMVTSHCHSTGSRSDHSYHAAYYRLRVVCSMTNFGRTSSSTQLWRCSILAGASSRASSTGTCLRVCAMPRPARGIMQYARCTMQSHSTVLSFRPGVYHLTALLGHTNRLLHRSAPRCLPNVRQHFRVRFVVAL